MEDKEYEEIPRGNKTLKDPKLIRLAMILFTIVTVLFLISSMHFEFTVDADGAKHMSISFNREQSEAVIPPPLEKSERLETPVKSEPVPDIRNVEQLMLAAKQLTEMDLPWRARAYYNKVIELDPNNAAAYVGRAHAYVDTRQYRRAIADGTKAVELDPNNMSAYVERGRAYYYTNQYDEALIDLNKAIASGTDLAVAYNARGCVYHALKEYERALNDFNEATAIDPNFQKPYNNRVVLFEEMSKRDRDTAEKLKK